MKRNANVFFLFFRADAASGIKRHFFKYLDNAKFHVSITCLSIYLSPSNDKSAVVSAQVDTLHIDTRGGGVSPIFLGQMLTQSDIFELHICQI